VTQNENLEEKWKDVKEEEDINLVNVILAGPIKLGIYYLLDAKHFVHLAWIIIINIFK